MLLQMQAKFGEQVGGGADADADADASVSILEQFHVFSMLPDAYLIWIPICNQKKETFSSSNSNMTRAQYHKVAGDTIVPWDKQGRQTFPFFSPPSRCLPRHDL
jgi:hypothetical protein